MLIKVNPAVSIGEKLLMPSEEDLNLISSSEHVDISFFEETKYLRYIFSKVKLQKKHKYITAKIKFQNIKKGEFTCIPGFHTDTTSNLFRIERPEIHHLFITSDFARTEFITTQFEMDINEKTSLQEQQSIIDSMSYETFSIPILSWVTYGRLNYHRGVIAKESGIRLLVRIDETDIVKPKFN